MPRSSRASTGTLTVLGAGPEPRNCLRPRARPAALTTWTARAFAVPAARRRGAAVPVDDRFVQVAVRAVDHSPAGDIELGKDVLHPAHHVGQLGRGDGASAVGQRAAVPGIGARRQQHGSDDREPVARQSTAWSMWLLSAGDCSPLISRAAGIAGRTCRLMSCTVRISRWIRASAPKMPALAGHAVDLLAGPRPAGISGTAAGRRTARRAARRRVRPRRYSAACSAGARWRRPGCRRPGRRSAPSSVGRAPVRPPECAAVGAVVVRPALGVDEGLVGEGDAPERCRVAAVVRVRGPGGLAVRHFDLLLRRRHGDPEDLVMRAAALRQAEILFVDGAGGENAGPFVGVRRAQFNRLEE